MSLKIAIVGCGAVTELFYAPCLREIADADIDILYDPDKKRLDILKRWFPRARVADSLSVVIASRPQLAIVASPPRFHAEQCIALSNEGIAVFCEKPLASSSDEGLRMIEAARNADRPLGVGLFRRFLPVNEAIFSILRDREIGSAVTFEISEGAEFNWPAQSNSFFSKSGSAGGVLADVGIHVLDLLVWWFGLPSELDYEDDAVGGLEANCMIHLRYPNGLKGRVRLSRDTRLANRMVVQCDRGWLQCDAGTPKHLEIGFRGSQSGVSGVPVLIQTPRPEFIETGGFHYAFMQQLKNALDAARGMGRMGVDGDEALRSLRLVEECYRRRKLMPMPWMSDQEFEAAVRIAGS